MEWKYKQNHINEALLLHLYMYRTYISVFIMCSREMYTVLIRNFFERFVTLDQ